MWTSPDRAVRSLPTVGKLLLSSALIAGGWWTARTVREELKGDPLAAFRGPRGPVPPSDVGLSLKNVRLRRYVGRAVRTQLVAGELAITRDRNLFRLTTIRDGLYRGPIGPKGRIAMRFAAGKGDYSAYTSRLRLEDGVRASGPRFALAARELVFDGRSRVARLARGVSGTAYGGKLNLGELTYNLARGSFVVAKGSYNGKLPAEMFGQEEPVTRRTWNIVSNGPGIFTGGIGTYRNLTASDGEVIVVSPQGTWNRATDVLTAVGGIKYYSGRANLVADKVTIYRKEKRAIFEGNVRMLVKPKSEEAKGPVVEPIPPFTPLPPEKVVAGKDLPPEKLTPKETDRVRSGKSVRDYPLVIVAAKVDSIYARGRRVANISGGSPQARQELGDGAWRQVWTDLARYDAENEILRLSSSPGESDARMKNSLGDDLTADWFELSTKPDDDEYTGTNVRGSVVSTDENDTRPPPAKTDAAKPPASKPPASKPATSKPPRS